MIEYNITATRTKKIEECKLEWRFSFNITKLSYEKEFTYTVYANGIIKMESFTLGPGKNLHISFFGCVKDIESDIDTPKVKLTWTKDIYELGSCSVSPTDKIESIEEELPLHIKKTGTKVKLSDIMETNPYDTAIFIDPSQLNKIEYKKFVLEHTFIDPPKDEHTTIYRLKKLLGHEGIDPSSDIDTDTDSVVYNYLVHLNMRNKCIHNTATIVVFGEDKIKLNESSSMVTDNSDKDIYKGD